MAYVKAAEPLPVIVVRSLEELRALRTRRDAPSEFTLVIELRGVAPPQREAASARIASYRSECGCSLGARCMAAGFVLSLVLLAVCYGVFTAEFLWRLPLAFLFAIVCAGLGKTAGILRARSRLKREIETLAASQKESCLEV